MKEVTSYSEQMPLEGDPDGPPFLRRMAEVFDKLADSVPPAARVVRVGVEQSKTEKVTVCRCRVVRRDGNHTCTDKAEEAKPAQVTVFVKIEREL